MFDYTEAVLATCCQAFVVDEKLTAPSSRFLAQREVYSFPSAVSDISRALAF